MCPSWIPKARLDYNAGMSASIALRPATPEDAEAAAPLIYSTQGTLGDFLFGRPGPEGTIRVLAALFREPGHILSYQYSTLAEAEGTIAGIAQEIPEAELSKATLRLPWAVKKCFGWGAALGLARRGFPLAFEGDAEPGELYVNTLAVGSAFRKRGIGRALLEDAERRARRLHIPTCSLSVMLHNTEAFHFYQRVGYRIDRKVISKLHAPGVQYSGFHRMIKPVEGRPAETDRN